MKFLLLGLVLVACNQEAVEVPPEQSGHEFPLARSGQKQEASAVEPAAEADVPDWSIREGRYPYVCEEFDVRIDEEGRGRFRRHRKQWTETDRRRFRRLVAMVAREMGAEPRLFNLWALRESTYRPDAVHVLNPDLAGARKAWERYRWSPERQAELEGIMKTRQGIMDRPYWEAKGALQRIQTFRDNPYYFDRVEYDVHMAEGQVLQESRSRWSYGYGAFGFNPTFYVPVWDDRAPPWVFCNEDGIIAAVTAVWAARAYQSKCRALGYEGTYADVNRMFSAGNCQPRPSFAAGFRKRARAVGLEPEQRARFGKKWLRSETDREEIVRYMRARAVEKGILPPPGQRLAQK